LSTSAHRLITNEAGGVIGIEVQGPEGPRKIQARHGVVLACGGFENNPEMQRQYWQGKPVLTPASRANTGDGIRMAQAVGADLWHMWHYHGSYAFRHPDPDFPFALRTKRLPDWNPLHKDTLDIKLAWIVVDQKGRRYMNEWPPYTQDTGWRPMELFDPETQTFPRIPSYLIADEACRRLYPLGDSTSNDREYFYDWSEDNAKEIELGILHQADTISGLAAKIDVDPAILEETIALWNALCAKGEDKDFGRPKGTLQPITEPPFIFGEVWPTVSNTQGGPVHDARQRVLNSFGEPIPGLYAAGELGSAFGHLYLSGSNLTECFVSGRIAGREAARLRND
jgi:succinate dehydrogenase/fumarate reductase flavoprotein subunit